MNCPAWQQLLDDFPRGLPPGALEQHALGCSECAARQPELQALLLALPHLTPPELPAGLEDRITAAVLADHRNRSSFARRWGPVVALVAAASLLLVVVTWGWRPSSPTVPVRVPVVRNERPSLREVAQKARQAGERLIARAAVDTAEQAASLFPPVGPVSIEPNTGPALKPLRETADEVRAGMAPVTTSARRAVNLFLRDLPLGLKPG
jgi:hypothetical protein